MRKKPNKHKTTKNNKQTKKPTRKKKKAIYLPPLVTFSFGYFIASNLSEINGLTEC